jgi:hypothetical protein
LQNPTGSFQSDGNLWHDFPARDDNQRSRVVVSYLFRNGYDPAQIAQWIAGHIEKTGAFEECADYLLAWVKAVNDGRFLPVGSEKMLNVPEPEGNFADRFAVMTGTRK